MKERIKSLFTENVVLKLIALLTGFLIWLFVTNSDDPVKTILISNVPITITNESSVADIDKVVQPEGSGTVTLRVSERRSVLNRLSRTGSDFSVVADMEMITDMNTVPLTVTCTNSSVTWDEIELSPSSLKVKLEDKVEQAFPISVTTSGSTASGYAVGTTEPDIGRTILLAGPVSLINIIDKVTAPVNVNGMQEDAQLSSTLRVYDKNGSELTDSQLGLLEFKTSDGIALIDRGVTVSVVMWKVQSDIRLKIFTYGEPEDGYRVGSVTTIPDTISLAGTDEALNELQGTLEVLEQISVAGADSNLEVELDLSETLTEMENLKMLPDADSTLTVNIVIEKSDDVAMDYPLSEIELQNEPENMKLVFTPADKIVLSIHSEDPADRQLSTEDVSVSIDLSECSEPGNYEIPVEVTLPDGYELSETVVLKVSAALPQTDENVEEETE